MWREVISIFFSFIIHRHFVRMKWDYHLSFLSKSTWTLTAATAANFHRLIPFESSASRRKHCKRQKDSSAVLTPANFRESWICAWFWGAFPVQIGCVCVCVWIECICRWLLLNDCAVFCNDQRTKAIVMHLGSVSFSFGLCMRVSACFRSMLVNWPQFTFKIPYYLSATQIDNSGAKMIVW